MADFSIQSISKEDIIPVASLNDTIVTDVLPAFDQFYLTSDFGDMSFQGFKGDGFEIWYSNYWMKRPVTLIGTADIPVLELQIPFQDNFSSSWDGFGDTSLKQHQFEMSYTPYVNNKAHFDARHYHNIDFHWNQNFLYPFSDEFPQLDHFLNNIEKGRPSHLIGGTQFLSNDMIVLLKEIMRTRYRGIMAERFYESAVTLVLLKVLERIKGVASPSKILSPADIEIALEAKRIILSDLENSNTIRSLAKKIGTNVSTLKRAFRDVHGVTIFKFTQEVRIEYAKQLLLETNYTIQTIAEMVGYTEGNNFSDAFKSIAGTTPGYFRKHK